MRTLIFKHTSLTDLECREKHIKISYLRLLFNVCNFGSGSGSGLNDVCCYYAHICVLCYEEKSIRVRHYRFV